jgi:hypothetical protein
MEDYNLLIINTDSDNIIWENCIDKYKKIFDEYIELINSL